MAFAVIVNGFEVLLALGSREKVICLGSKANPSWSKGYVLYHLFECIKANSSGLVCVTSLEATQQEVVVELDFISGGLVNGFFDEGPTNSSLLKLTV